MTVSASKDVAVINLAPTVTITATDAGGDTVTCTIAWGNRLDRRERLRRQPHVDHGRDVRCDGHGDRRRRCDECRTLVVKPADGSVHTAEFRFKGTCIPPKHS